MATSQYASTTETTNASRVSRVLIGPCSDQLRDILRCHVSPSSFPQVIRRHRKYLPNLTKPQMDLILPKTGHYSGNYSDMDISLLYMLLRNICGITPHSNGWGKDPDASDWTLSANIERIRNIRNHIGHSISSSLSSRDFNDIWKTVHKAVAEMDKFLNNNNKYENDLRFLRTETMDSVEADEYEEKIRKQVEEDTKTREMIEETNKKVENQQRQLKSLETRRSTQNIYHFNVLTQHIHSTQAVIEDKRCIDRLKGKLLDKNTYETKRRMHEGGETLQIEHIFEFPVIREDSIVSSKCKKLSRKWKHVKAPTDMLTKNNKEVSHVLLLGDAGHGKTTFCIWLLYMWCNIHTNARCKENVNEWERYFSQYDFVFYLPLRHVDPSRAKVLDMICLDIFGTDSDLEPTITQVLSGKEYRCFIIMDGLDEWKPNQTAIDQLRYKGMPNIDSMSNCTIFTTTRPWKLLNVTALSHDDPVVFTILGLDDENVEALIEKVLLNHLKMKQETVEYTLKRKDVISKLQNETFKSILKIPLLAVISALNLDKERDFWKGMTSFYSNITDMLIERVLSKKELNMAKDKQIYNNCLPEILSENENIKSYLSPLLKLGRVALKALLFEEDNLVLQHRKFMKELGEAHWRFAFEVGLISQKEAPGVDKRNVCVHFFHRSLQEFLAAICIVTVEEDREFFCQHISNVDEIMKLSNVIMFIYGICPSLSSVISECVVHAASKTIAIDRYREFPREGNVTVENLFILQIRWYMELQNGISHITVTNHVSPPYEYNVSDVYLCESTDVDIVQATKQLLSDDNVTVVSLWLNEGNESTCITNNELDSFLSKAHQKRSMVMLYINDFHTTRYLHMISGQRLKTLWLLNGRPHEKYVDCPLIRDTDLIQNLCLNNFSLGDRVLGLSANMAFLREITLDRVDITRSGWSRFIQSLVLIEHRFDISTRQTNISNISIIKIRSSQHFSVKREYFDRNNRYFDFSRIWPLNRVYEEPDLSNKDLITKQPQHQSTTKKSMESPKHIDQHTIFKESSTDKKKDILKLLQKQKDDGKFISRYQRNTNMEEFCEESQTNTGKQHFLSKSLSFYEKKKIS